MICSFRYLVTVHGRNHASAAIDVYAHLLICWVMILSTANYNSHTHHIQRNIKNDALKQSDILNPMVKRQAGRYGNEATLHKKVKRSEGRLYRPGEHTKEKRSASWKTYSTSSLV
jgi:hypothetical protein